ncbi:DUF2752 domain-containing protein [Gordonia aichiensis]|uniref:DUF2752 domain-containing protein n=1 Tax=Gordonia aichiensis TaxID=36820 RepID=UPI0032631BC0
MNPGAQPLGRRLGRPAIIGGVGAAVCAAVWIGRPSEPGGILPPCPIKVLLNIDCPGCGATRALDALMHGDPGAAMHFNALAVVAFLALVVGYLGYVVGRWRGRPIVADWTRWRPASKAVLVLVVVWFVVRNVPVAPFTGLQV